MAIFVASGARPAEPRVARVVALISGTVTFALCISGASRSYGYDESVTIANFVDQPLFTPFFHQTVANNHPLFSFLEQLVFKAGATSELSMRVLPAGFAALTVAFLGHWAARRWGTASGVVAATVLGAHPMFIDYGRQARGYSLLVLAALVSTMALIRIIEDPDHRTARVTVLYVLTAGAGLATHLYMLPVLAGHFGLVVGRRHLSKDWVRNWLLVSAIGLLAYMNAVPVSRAGQFRPRFPIDTIGQLLGGTGISIAVLGTCSLAALWYHRSDWLAVVLPVTFLVLLWTVVQPKDFYPRFFVFLTPAIAGAAGWVMTRYKLAWPILVFAAFTMVPFQRPLDSGLRATAGVFEQTLRAGHTPCAVGSEALVAYVDEPIEFAVGRDCYVIARVGTWTPDGLEAALESMVFSSIHGPVQIYSLETPNENGN